MNLNKELDEIASFVPMKEMSALEVSNSTVGWQIAHMLKVIDSICSAVSSTDPQKYKYRFNISRLIILSTGYIPRGKGKAPKVAIPNESDLTNEAIQQQLETLRQKLKSLESLDKNCYFKHPYFGHLNMKHTRRFLQVHTNHHLKIVRDIVAKA